MASDGDPVKIPATSLVHGSQAITTVRVPQLGGKVLPPSGNTAATAAAHRSPPAAKPDLQAQVALLNKYLNESGRPDQFRVAPQAGANFIQEINPATGQVIAEYPATEFPALARSLGVSGGLIDSRA
jgi:uncharacterized FlaG/YvyC family protein